VGGKLWFFYDASQGRADNQKTGSSTRWADIYQQLIASGHRAECINNYTQRQIILYYGAVVRADNYRRAGAVTDMNMAFAGGKNANDWIKKLTSK
jgi:hypothetical protein